MPKRKKKSVEKQVVGFLGVGLDNQDGETRLTRSEYFVLVGGSERTHERMQDAAIKFTDELHKRGKKLQEAPPEEVIDLLRRAHE